jgi:4-hydroxybenzoate polyprenyltransferase
MLSYAAMLLVLGYVGYQLGMGWPYYAGLLLALAIAGYHYTLIRTRSREGCFRAFRLNHWLGATVFAGVVAGYALR